MTIDYVLRRGRRGSVGNGSVRNPLSVLFADEFDPLRFDDFGSVVDESGERCKVFVVRIGS